MSGLVWVMEWTSVIAIMMRIPKKKKKQPNQIQAYLTLKSVT